jgi:hypothetical protein
MDDVVSRWKLHRYAGDRPVTLYRAVGCEHCGHTGYSGRNAIVELLVMTDPIKQLILKHSDAGKITRVARKGGMHSMLEDGLRKVVAGVTTIEEVRRVTQEQAQTQQAGENPASTGAGAAADETEAYEPATAASDPGKTDSPKGGYLKTLSRLKRRE